MRGGGGKGRQICFSPDPPAAVQIDAAHGICEIICFEHARRVATPRGLHRRSQARLLQKSKFASSGSQPFGDFRGEIGTNQVPRPAGLGKAARTPLGARHAPDRELLMFPTVPGPKLSFKMKMVATLNPNRQHQWGTDRFMNPQDVKVAFTNLYNFRNR